MNAGTRSRLAPREESSASAVPMAEFLKRRRQLMRMTGRDSIVIVGAAPERIRNNDAHYPYRQDSDFHYLTGFPEPEAVVVLIPGRAHGEHILFCRERDPERERWDGPRVGAEGAVAQYGFDDAFPIGDIDDILPGMIEGRTRVYYHFGRDTDFDLKLMGWVNRVRSLVRSGAQAPHEFVALGHLLHDMRLYKSRAELRVMRRAARITADAHVRAMRAVRPGMNEATIEAELLHEFRVQHAVAAYEPIVGGGANACVLHYRGNSAPLRDGDLLLVDAGAEFQCYASDVTRTFPVNGRYTPEQRAIYEVVLDAQLAAISAVRAGNSWIAPHEAALRWRVSRARARDGHDGRAGHLHRARRKARRREVAWHRRADRGRRRRDEGRSRGPDQRRAEGSRRNRANDGAVDQVVQRGFGRGICRASPFRAGGRSPAGWAPATASLRTVLGRPRRVDTCRPHLAPLLASRWRRRSSLRSPVVHRPPKRRSAVPR
jgi:Xaa-Pro aminopeptidase